jgi:hypothetical protein
VTPNCEPYWVAPGHVERDAVDRHRHRADALVTDGMSIGTVPTGAVGVPPLAGKVIVVDAAGLPPAVAIGVPLAAT